MALFTYLLPSLIRTLDCGFRYEYVLGYDLGDPFYDNAEGMQQVEKWFNGEYHGALFGQKACLPFLQVVGICVLGH